MSGLALLGGVGKGLLAGSQFVQNKNQQDARLGMLQEQHQASMDDRKREGEERERSDMFGRLQMNIRSQYSDRPREEQEAMIVEQGLKAGIMKPAEYEQAMQTKAKLDKLGLTEELKKAYTTGDVSGLSKRYGTPLNIAKFKNQWGEDDVMISTPTGQQLPFSWFASIEGVDAFAKMQEAQQEAAKTRSEITENQAQAIAARASAGASSARSGLYHEQTRGERLSNEGLAALAPAERTRASRAAGGEGATALQKDAAYLVRNGLAPDLAAAVERLRSDPGESTVRNLTAQILADARNRKMTAADARQMALGIIEAERQAGTPGAIGPREGDPGEDFSALWR